MIRGSTINLPTRNVSLDIDLSIHNKFDIEVVESSSGEVKEKAEAYNIIKNTLWARLCSSDYPDWFKQIHFGEGTGTPTPDSIGLFQRIGSKSVTFSSALDEEIQYYPDKGYAYRRCGIQLAPNEYVGYTFTEVGIGYDSSNTSICTHAMLQDMNGNQISITKTDTDIINIYATVYVHWNPEGYDDGHIQFAAFSNARLGSIISELLGAIKYYSHIDHNAYFYGGPPATKYQCINKTVALTKNVSNRTYTFTIPRLNVADGNISTGLRYVQHRGLVVSLPCTGVPGTTIRGESVGTGDGVITEFNTKFPLPSSASVYVDGVLSTDVVVDGEDPGVKWPAGYRFEYMPRYSEDWPGMMFAPISLDGSTQREGSSSYKTYVCYNPWYQYGIAEVNMGHRYSLTYEFEASDDLITWHKACNGRQSGTSYIHHYPIVEEYAYCKYWRFKGSTSGKTTQDELIAHFVPIIPFKNNIRFTTPPPEGAVITADYYTPVVAKDENHVFDMTITMHLGEYTE